MMTPHDKMLQAFPAAHESGGYWHHEDSPRFDWRVNDDGRISIKSWTNREAKDILAMGTPPLTLRDLYPAESGYTQTKGLYQKPSVLTLLDLRDYLKLEVNYLLSLGYQEGYSYRDKEKGRTYTGVKVGGYYAPDGTPHSRNKIRLSIDPNAKPRFVWDKNTPGEVIPCGYHKLGMAREQGFLIIGEGETDFATMVFHGLPFLGIGGANAWKQLDVSLLRAIPVVYLLEEPDQALKNLDEGKGFYGNGLTHLRDNGYEGEIFSIKFKQATGCKDPSDLHKSLYAHLDMHHEVVYRSELHTQFCHAIRSAMENALPEGAPCEDTGVTAWLPPMPTEESGRLAWIAELAALPGTVMSASHKMTLIAIVLHTSVWTTQEWWKIDSADLAKKAGQSRQAFLTNLAYLSQHIPLFEKKYERQWHADDANGKKSCSTDLFIQPSPTMWMAYPSTYRVAEGLPERKHGGVQVPRPKCERCQSEDIEVYETHYCRNCAHQTSVRIDTLADIVKSDDVNLTESNEEHEPSPTESDYVNLPPLYKDIYKGRQVDIVDSQLVASENVNLTESNADPEYASGASENVNLTESNADPLKEKNGKMLEKAHGQLDRVDVSFEVLCQQYGLRVDNACPTCGCPAQRSFAGSWSCARCLPGRTYHLYSDVIDARYPLINAPIKWGVSA